ncbi:MAG: serine dehydratase subunit alpha family protein [Dethiobacter sp.]|jgi:L-cysteine desulfidase|nr:serine dehydratase subunit alpha family protein [Dethiobacter sp.]
MTAEEILAFIKKEIVLAIGCTEPSAIALTAAHAYKLSPGKVEKIKMLASSNIYKNAKAVGIPGTLSTGVNLAVALGVVIKEPTLDLTIFSTLTDDDVSIATTLLGEIPLSVEIGYDLPSVYIDIEVKTSTGSGRAVISGFHTNLVLLKKGQKVIFSKLDEEVGTQKALLTRYPLEGLIEKVLSLPASSLEFLLQGIELNLKMAEAGTRMQGGMKIGSRWKSLMDRGLLGDDLTNRISYLTAAACDARMAGIQMAVMSSAGSGNHGLVAIIPIALAAEELKCSREKTAQALAISHLVTIYVKEYTGRLSPVCGCGVAAGSGASAGLAYLLGGEMNVITGAIKNMVSSLAGMICDGGKVGCALKLSTSASTAWYSALLAREGLEVPPGNGIVEESVSETLSNLGKVSREGMAQVDRAVISVLERHSA